MKISQYVVAGVIFLFLIACTATPSWDLNGKSEQQFDSDGAYCSAMIRKEKLPWTKKKYDDPQILIPDHSFTNVPADENAMLYETCMAQLGYIRLK